LRATPRAVEQHPSPTYVLSRALPWLSLALVWLLFELPRALATGVFAPSALQLSLELPLLLTLLGLQRLRMQSAWCAGALGVMAGLLIAYRLDQAICWLLMREEPLLYDQWFMARHLWVLIGDLMSVWTLAVLVGLALLGWLLTRAVALLLGRASRLLEPARRRATALAVLAFWLLALLLPRVFPRVAVLPAWLTPAVIDNVQRSRALYRTVQRESRHSPHAHYQHLTLHDTPDVLLFIVESYGRLLSVDDGTRPAHAALLRSLEDELTRAGWHAASAFSSSTVSGGRSWIAEGTMLMGLPIKYESEFQHLIGLRPQPPHLVSFLNRQGYRSVLLAPADRDRPGAYVVNRYGFSTLLTYAQLAYRGPSYGWGIVPDQYSLALAAQRVLPPRAERDRPVFLDFHMVSSHAPWDEVPPLVDDPLTVRPSALPPPVYGTPEGTVLRRLSRYDRTERRFPWMEQLDGAMRRGYQTSIDYDLRVLARYLAERADDALVIILGDHQPPVIATADQSFDAPVHVLSRAPQRLQTVLARGFVPGLTLPGDAPPTMSHADVFPLVVETLRSRSP
jgi:hypothetical protein